MKKFLKILLAKNNLILLIVFLLAAFVRFYNFPNRVTFWSEQARSLIVSGNYIKDKFSLLGQEYFREDSNSHILYSGAVFNYSLVPLMLISNYDPVRITAFFALLNLFTGMVLYWVIEKFFGYKLAILSLFLFLFNSYMIYHSLFIWNYNYLPLVGILVFYFSRKKNLFLAGIMSGIGVSLQFLFLPIAVTVLVINLIKSKNKFWGICLFLLGMVIGNFPMVIFDLRHNFYHLRTLSQYFIDTIRGKSDAGFSYYYSLPFWPFFAFLGAWIILRVNKINKLLAIFTIVVYLYFNLASSRISWVSPTGMPKGLTTRLIDKASQEIADNTDGQFNVSEVLDFDKKAYVFRYFLQFKYFKPPLPVSEYQNINLLYVLAPNDYNFTKSGVWEVNASNLVRKVKIADMGASLGLYKFSK